MFPALLSLLYYTRARDNYESKYPKLTPPADASWNRSCSHLLLMDAHLFLSLPPFTSPLALPLCPVNHSRSSGGDIDANLFKTLNESSFAMQSWLLLLPHPAVAPPHPTPRALPPHPDPCRNCDRCDGGLSAAASFPPDLHVLHRCGEPSAAARAWSGGCRAQVAAVVFGRRSCVVGLARSLRSAACPFFRLRICYRSSQVPTLKV